MKFKLITNFEPKGDQPKAIKELVNQIDKGNKFQVLLGATGTGKTFTIANVIQKTQKKTLVLANNKTLAMQLYGELRTFFPNNKVEYFISYFDFYQPEAYLPANDIYISKTAKVNEDIKMFRLSTMNSLISRNDVIVVASVAAIYGAHSPEEYKKSKIYFSKNQKINLETIIKDLIKIGYLENEKKLIPGFFTRKENKIILVPSWTEKYNILLEIKEEKIETIAHIDIITNEIQTEFQEYTVFPAQEYITEKQRLKEAIKRIQCELDQTIIELRKENKLIEIKRLEKRTRNDIQALENFQRCQGIENYSRHLDLRNKGEPPYTLIDYFGNDFLTIVDESHMTLPQIRGMYNTNMSRKSTLVKYGFRLPSAIDNRPLNFDEFQSKLNYVIYQSATPGDYETKIVNNNVVQQIIRPTGLIDPWIEIKNNENQIEDIIFNIKKCQEAKSRVLILTLTIKTAEDLTFHLQKRNLNVAYLHSKLKTFERTKVIIDLRKGIYDAVIGINLLREGIDIPEVALVCIIDADKSGFLRDQRSLIQIMGRAARNVNGRVILYANKISKDMKKAIEETNRRRNLQISYNKDNKIIPKTVYKSINEVTMFEEINFSEKKIYKSNKERLEAIKELKEKMLVASKNWKFREAAKIRDLIFQLQSEIKKKQK
jgi:excinuclease ABC subunit B